MEVCHETLRETHGTVMVQVEIVSYLGTRAVHGPAFHDLELRRPLAGAQFGKPHTADRLGIQQHTSLVYHSLSFRESKDTYIIFVFQAPDTAQSLSLPDRVSAREWIGVEGRLFQGRWKRSTNPNYFSVLLF